VREKEKGSIRRRGGGRFLRTGKRGEGQTETTNLRKKPYSSFCFERLSLLKKRGIFEEGEREKLRRGNRERKRPPLVANEKQQMEIKGGPHYSKQRREKKRQKNAGRGT